MVITTEQQAEDAANMQSGISEAQSVVGNLVTRAERYGMPDVSHELRVAMVALQRAAQKAQAAA